jgi:acetyl esterase/lipase
MIMDEMAKDILENELFLWEKSAPGSEKLSLREEVEERHDSGYRDRAISSISRPSLIPMFPGKPVGTSVLICPGGGYQKVVIDKEGFEVGKWLNTLGITAFILKYRLPGEGHERRHLVPLQDAQRAIRIIKNNAVKWNIDPMKTGVMGFSAGGHLASTVSTKYSLQSYEPVDGIDGNDARVAFQILAYPVITMNEAFGHRGSAEKLLGENADEKLVKDFSNELQTGKDDPPAFIFHATDDGAVPSENSVLFYLALRRMEISAELHVFKNAGHGFALRSLNEPVRVWPELCREWLETMGMI